MRQTRFVALTLVALLSPLVAAAMPQPLALPPAIASAEDRAYPGTLTLEVDATDTARGIFHVRQTIPVERAGPLTLLYPQWLPGKHSPAGPVDKLAGLIIRADGKRLDWRRDSVDVYAFHLDVPQGATRLDLEFQFLSPITPTQGRRVMTPEMLNLQWNTVALYPAGFYARGITVEPAVRLPSGWRFATSLTPAATSGDVTRFRPVSLERLVDSPMFAGRHFKSFDLTPPGEGLVRLNVVADRPEYLNASPAQIEAHRAMVQEAAKLFKSRHFDRYDFLFALSDELSGIGLEHLKSSENAVAPGYFTEWDQKVAGRDLLPHEYVHSWNGKFRRGEDLWTPTFNAPMRDSLLWVYEGQTQYWGIVLAARSGLYSKQQALDALALVAANYANQPGRNWRPLLDTTNDPIIAQRNSMPWGSWQRREDYYNEGLLIWLDADTLIRERSGGKRSLDNFASAFFGIRDGSETTVTYNFTDVVTTLTDITPHDWTAFLKARVDDVSPQAPLDGITRGGYELVFEETPSAYHMDLENQRKFSDHRFSLGLNVAVTGIIAGVIWDSPAFNAGLKPGLQIIAVNQRSFDAAVLKRAITDAKTSRTPIEILVKDGDRFESVKLAYYDGLRYPRLARLKGKPALLDAILAPRR